MLELQFKFKLKCFLQDVLVFLYLSFVYLLTEYLYWLNCQLLFPECHFCKIVLFNQLIQVQI